MQVIADEQALERAQSMIDSRCRTLCREAGTPVGNARYCEERLRPIDLNNNRRTDGYSASLSILGVCEDAIYCHVVYDCPRVTTADCVKHMCDYFTDSLGLTPTDAHARVNSRLDPGSCYEELSGDELRDHWWTVLDSNSNTNSSAWCD